MDRVDPSVLDVLFQCLAHRRRRAVLSYLVEGSDGTAAVDDLVNVVVAAETHSPSPDRDAVALTLVHTHLPKLAEYGLLEYDHDRARVKTTDRTTQVLPYLATVEQVQRSVDTAE